MEELTIGTKVVLNVGGKESIARVTDKNGTMMELTTESGETLFMELQKAGDGWELVPNTRMVKMTTL
ncbi:MAG: hypothetical protein UU95_C0017G0013 [Parcubacteria group bacterium GW2011_GWC2_42_12]|nr:MAG: hypothetical protein UU95_C0017G0013 [Parcubacteria group bacterium GW2011_GWC2_42_12]